MRVCGWQTCTRNESNRLDFFVLHNRPTSMLAERFEYYHTGSDPKDGELCVSRVKSGETLMEARSGTDVQIVRQTCV
jgi:hypothetical protein